MNKISYKFVLFLVLLYVSPMIVWWFIMSVKAGFTLSYDNQHWGAFGSFVGGILSPVFTLVSVIYIVKSINENRHIHDVTLLRFEKEERKQFILKLSELFRMHMSKKTDEIQSVLNENAPKLKPSVRMNLYDYNRNYKNLSDEEKYLWFGIVGNLTCNAESAFQSVVDVLLIEMDVKEREQLISLVWAAFDMNDIVELLNYNKKNLLWSNLKSSPLLDSLVILNTKCDFFKESISGYSDVVKFET